jgi:hypothetical protein
MDGNAREGNESEGKVRQGNLCGTASISKLAHNEGAPTLSALRSFRFDLCVTLELHTRHRYRNSSDSETHRPTTTM